MKVSSLQSPVSKCGFKKGQYFSFDAIVASVLFALTFITLVSYWFSVKSGLESKDEEMLKEAARISDAMLNPGLFQNSYSDPRVSLSRIKSFEGKSQDELKEMFNTPYNISLLVDTEAGTRIAAVGPDPTDPAYSYIFSNVVNTAKMRRIVVIQVNESYETPAALDIYLYN